MGWNDLRNSNAKDARITEQQAWAKRRQSHIDQAQRGEAPGMIESGTRAIGNLYSNWNLDRAESRDLDWSLHEKDQKGLIDSPVDAARFNVYERMLKSPDPATQRAWAEIVAGHVPVSEVD